MNTVHLFILEQVRFPYNMTVVVLSVFTFGCLCNCITYSKYTRVWEMGVFEYRLLMFFNKLLAPVKFIKLIHKYSHSLSVYIHMHTYICIYIYTLTNRKAKNVALCPVTCSIFCLLVLLFQTKITRPFLHHMFTKAQTSTRQHRLVHEPAATVRQCSLSSRQPLTLVLGEENGIW